MKERLLTILLGLTAGTILGGVILLGPKILDNKFSFNFKLPSVPAATTPLPQPAQTPKTVAENKQTFTLDSPADNTVASESPFLVLGVAPAGSTIFIFGPADEKTATASADGSYSAKLKLEDGENEISATLLGDKMQTIKKSVTLEITQ